MPVSQPVKVEFRIPNITDYVGVVRLGVSGIANRMKFSVEDIEDIKIAVSEACANAVQHAYGNGNRGVIDVICFIHSSRLEIEVKDAGKGFDLESVSKLRYQTKEKPGLGLGITFMKSLMDEVSFDTAPNKGTRVRLIKNAPKVLTS